MNNELRTPNIDSLTEDLPIEEQQAVGFDLMLKNELSHSGVNTRGMTEDKRKEYELNLEKSWKFYDVASKQPLTLAEKKNLLPAAFAVSTEVLHREQALADSLQLRILVYEALLDRPVIADFESEPVDGIDDGLLTRADFLKMKQEDRAMILSDLRMGEKEHLDARHAAELAFGYAVAKSL